MNKKFLFVLNPKAGYGRAKNIEQKIRNLFTSQEADIEYTRYAGHATELSRLAASGGYYAAVAAGGDGTVNEVAAGLINTSTALGIIPVGSGNGFAHTLNVPRSTRKALERIRNGTPLSIDTFTVNGKIAVNVAGAGFDGLIIHHYARAGKHGFANYFILIVKHYLGFREQEFEVVIDGKTEKHKALLVEIANGPEYGNHAIIAPEARIRDGWLDVIVLRKFNLLRLPVAVYRLFAGKPLSRKLAYYRKGKHIIVRTSSPAFLHIDGEKIEPANFTEARINPDSLMVIGS